MGVILQSSENCVVRFPGKANGFGRGKNIKGSTSGPMLSRQVPQKLQREMSFTIRYNVLHAFHEDRNHTNSVFFQLQNHCNLPAAELCSAMESQRLFSNAEMHGANPCNGTLWWLHILGGLKISQGRQGPQSNWGFKHSSSLSDIIVLVPLVP